jgi:hypothetical protein
MWARAICAVYSGSSASYAYCTGFFSNEKSRPVGRLS